VSAGTLRVALVLVALATVLAVAAVAEAASQYRSPANYTFYPCSSCHATMDVSGVSKNVEIHGIDLTKGAHKGLYCVNCHSVPDVWNLKTPDGKAEIAIPGMFSHEDLMKMNKVCASCHKRTYEDYINLVHGNKTYTCPDGTVEFVKGYKGVLYAFHVCKEYKNLKTVPAKACVECHDPHDPVYRAISILPPPSERPPPPPQENIAYGTLAVAIAGMALIVVSAVLLQSHYAEKR